MLTNYFNASPITIPLSHSILESCIEAKFVDAAKAACADLELNPAFLFYIVELLREKIHIEMTLCATL